MFLHREIDPTREAEWTNEYYIIPVRIYDQVPDFTAIDPLAFNHFLELHALSDPHVGKCKRVHWLPAREPHIEIISPGVMRYEAYEFWSPHCISKVQQFNDPRLLINTCEPMLSPNYTAPTTHNTPPQPTPTPETNMSSIPILQPINTDSDRIQNPILHPRASIPYPDKDHTYETVPVESVNDLVEFMEKTSVGRDNPFYYVDLTTNKKKVQELSVRTVIISDDDEPTPTTSPKNKQPSTSNTNKRLTTTRSMVGKTSEAILSILQKRRKASKSYKEKAGRAKVVTVEINTPPVKRTRNSHSTYSIQGTYV